MGVYFGKKENFKVPVRISFSVDYSFSQKIKKYSAHANKTQSEFFIQAVNDLIEKIDRETKETSK